MPANLRKGDGMNPESAPVAAVWSYARFYRGRKLHIAEGAATGWLNPPVVVERTTLCGLRLASRWFAVVGARFLRRPYCPACATAWARRQEGAAVPGGSRDDR